MVLLTVKRKLVKQASGVYTVTIPKGVVEANKLQDAEFEIDVSKDRIVLKRVRKT
jgi:antitoxin component of MazEF toxin-antitoxin module